MSGTEKKDASPPGDEQPPENNGDLVRQPELPDGLDDAALGEILDDASPEQRRAILQVVEASQSHSGWLPTPDFLEAYERILPGLAERIVAMPEREQAHRHQVVSKMLTDDKSLKSRGQNFAMASLVLLLAVSVLLIALGQYAWGARIAIFGIAGVVGIFVTGKWADVKTTKATEEEEV